MHSHNKLLHVQTDHSDCQMSPVSDSSNMVAPGPQEPEEKIYHPSDHGQFTDAHVPDFDAYLALYKKSMEEPDGRSCVH